MALEEISIFDFDSSGFSLGRKFGLLGRLYFTALSTRLKHLGIDKNFSVLILIDKMGDRCTQTFLADTLHIDKTMMVGVLDQLGEQGLVNRVQNPTDRRQYWIQLTEKGKQHLPEIKKTVRELNLDVLEGISPSDRVRIQKNLQLIYKNIKALSPS